MSETEVVLELDDSEALLLVDEFDEGKASHDVVLVTRLISLADGLQSVTGIGFRPKQVQIMASIQGGGYYSSLLTFDEDESGGGFVIAGSTSQAANSGQVGTTDGNYATFAIDSIDADGFTLSWVKTGTPVGLASLYALCFR